LKPGKEIAYALVIREVLSGGAVELQRWLTSGDFWGGMRSMIDCAFCTPTSLGREMDHRSKREFIRLIARLGRHQLTSGIHTWGIKPGIRKWTELFERWLK
jgi:hypothetical protein